MGRDIGDEAHIRPFSRYLQHLLDEHGIDLTALATRTGMSRVTVSRHVNGHVFPHYTNRRMYAEAFGLGISEFEKGWRTLAAKQVEAKSPREGVLIIGAVAASGWVESVVYQNDEPERLPISYPGGQRVYALRIRGESMMPTYQPDDILIVQDIPIEDIQDNSDVVVQLDGSMDDRSTFKRCIAMGDGRFKLMPLNPRYPTIECRVENVVRLGQVLGKYVPVSAMK